MIRRALILLAALPFLASARETSPTGIAEQRLSTSVNRVVEVAKASKDRAALIDGVKPILEDILSFETMTRRAIGPAWREFTPEQQREAVRLFTVLILRTYTAKFTPGEYPSVDYKPASLPSPGRVEIPTTALYRGSRYEVIYRIENRTPSPDDAKGWLISDVVIEGVSMVGSYRTQFDEEEKRGGATAVLESLRQSVAKAP